MFLSNEILKVLLAWVLNLYCWEAEIMMGSDMLDIYDENAQW